MSCRADRRSARHTIYLCWSTRLAERFFSKKHSSAGNFVAGHQHSPSKKVRGAGSRLRALAVVAFGALLGGKLRASTPASKEGKTHQSSPMNCSGSLGPTLLLSHHFPSTEIGRAFASRLRPAMFKRRTPAVERQTRRPLSSGIAAARVLRSAVRHAAGHERAHVRSPKADFMGLKCRSQATRSS